MLSFPTERPAEQPRSRGRLRWGSGNFCKLDQSGILAQNFSVCANLLRGFSRALRFRTLTKLSVKCSSYNCRASGAETCVGANSSCPPLLIFTLRICKTHSPRGRLQYQVGPHNQLQKLRTGMSAPHVCPAAVGHLYFYFALFTDIQFIRSSDFSCPSAHSSPTVVTGRRRTDFLRG